MNLPKVSLHEHLIASMRPELALKIARRNGLDITHFIADDTHYKFNLDDIDDFFKMYDNVCDVVKTPQDYHDIAYDFLTRSAAEGALYIEFQVCPLYYGVKDTRNIINSTIDLARYDDNFAALCEGINRAFNETGIKCNFVVATLRSWGNEGAMKVLDFIEQRPCDLFRGFGTVENENFGTFSDYAPAFERARKMGLGIAPHAGEQAGPESIRGALKLGATRIGHGFRCIEDKDLMDEIKARDILLEICPTGNQTLIPACRDLSRHPLRQIFDYGIKVCLNCDDAGMFGTTIGREYDLAKTELGFTDKELFQMTLNGLEKSFAPADMRNQMIATAKLARE